jgi:adenylylsulfate reductase, subunit B
MPPKIDSEKCDACGRCVEVCSEDVFYGSTVKRHPVISYPEECWHCGACDVECPKDAIYFYIPLPMRAKGRSVAETR